MPPKKDAFSDLFLSAVTGRKLNNLSMAERQKQQLQPLQKPLQTSLLLLLQNPKSDSWSNLDFLSNPSSGRATPSHIVQNDVLTPTQSTNSGPSKSASAVSSTSSLPYNDDPFAIFDTPAKPAGNTNVGGSLLDDEFTDVFPEQHKPQPRAKSNPPREVEYQQEAGYSQTPLRPASRQSQTSRTDSVVAELVDIGFSIEDANIAIQKKGPNLQECVNYIMNKNTDASTPRPERPRSLNKGEGINFNGIGQDLFKTANTFFNKSKKTVMKNLEQLQIQGNNSGSSSNLPEWMKNQEKYKSDAVEKKYSEADLDYGSDSENLNREEIERFMKLQREKDKEKAKKRYDGLKDAALNKIRGKQDSDHSRRELFDQPPSRPARPLPERRGTSEPLKRTPPKAPEPPAESLDIFGTDTGSTSLKSSLRDSSPLNQFDESDYNTSKATAQEAYRTGDYTGALEAYLICLNKLPSNHENRVIIFSNLGMVNKQVGHLKQSLENVDSGLSLIGESEIHNSGFSIAQKPVKYWYTKLITTKAEVLELLEKYEASLKFYSILIKELGVVDKKVMDGKRRVDKIVNPENYKAKPAPSKPAAPKAAPKPVDKATSAPKPSVDEVDPLVQDRINGRVQTWAQPKQGNLRSLLTNLDEVIPPNINMKPALRKLTTNELMLPKQVKIQYMKVISSIHPDKLASQCKDDKESELVCKGVFITLNEAWEVFKTENSL
ncbi:uncharacterized protein CANTADRAFT_49124 [Suhomyces tanzawaensis NRRL Y-17324]|uniref:UBA domain-containing protein n=1 Tax=Suhomyces tanzawaensis NRRL Y-17324 TaxID=984487 RepID=A0A1E4SLL2_9ASCO|nr:uncharacterized protein CANTADRAFT_49124 [Suhomyces tanzawaensis NRRL Y-17324]ODV80272.1 hypothetical protein CANTADRAFT_49124 [Suhomyces tanzawaensis NRRL Y-17324]